MNSSTFPTAPVHRREFRDFQALWHELSRSAVLSDAEFEPFTFKIGEVWLRFNRMTKGSAAIRIVALFSSTPLQQFEALLLVACTRAGGRPQVLWRSPDHAIDPSAEQLDELLYTQAGRSMVVLPWLTAGAAHPA